MIEMLTNWFYSLFRRPDLLTPQDVRWLNDLRFNGDNMTWTDAFRHQQGTQEIECEYYRELGGEG